MPLFRAGAARAFVRRHCALREVPGLDGLRLYLADDLLAVWHATQLELGDEEAPLPYWAAAWAGGLALASYLRDRPSSVAGRRVLDFGSGSGMVGIAAAQFGAESVVAVDIDPLAIGAIQLNSKANGLRVDAVRRDLLARPVPDGVDLVLAADCWYEATFAEAVTPWLRRVAGAGVEVLVGDPGRRFLPVEGLDELAPYEVRTTAELEDLDQHRAWVYRLWG